MCLSCFLLAVATSQHSVPSVCPANFPSTHPLYLNLPRYSDTFHFILISRVGAFASSVRLSMICVLSVYIISSFVDYYKNNGSSNKSLITMLYKFVLGQYNKITHIIFIFDF